MVWGHGDLSRAGHGNHKKLSVIKLAHPPTLGGDNDDPVTLRLCVTCPPATWEPQGQLEWEGFPLRDHRHKQIDHANKFPPYRHPNSCQR